jgi:hypothetical protein
VGDSAGRALRGRRNDLRGAEMFPLQRRRFMAGMSESEEEGQKGRLCWEESNNNAAWCISYSPPDMLPCWSPRQ